MLVKLLFLIAFGPSFEDGYIQKLVKVCHKEIMNGKRIGYFRFKKFEVYKVLLFVAETQCSKG